MHKHLCVSFPLVQQRARELSWDSGPALGTQDVMWYRGIVAFIILIRSLVSAAWYLWLSGSWNWCLQLFEAGSDSALAVLSGGISST